MFLDTLLIGSLIGYAVHRGHRSPGEAVSELVWIILGITSAVFLYRPTSVVLQLDKAVGDGLANVFGFAVVSLVFLALRHFFVAVHHKDAVRERNEHKEEGEEQEETVPLNWLSVFVAGISGALTTSFALLLWAAIPPSVFPGNSDAMSASVFTGSVIEMARPLSPALDQLVVAAWKDSEALIGKGTAGATAESGEGSFTLSPEQEIEMLAAVNEIRQGKDLRPLVLDDGLTRLARDHGMDMASNNFFSHTSPTRGDLSRRIEVSGLKFQGAGENLAKARSVNEAMSEFMNSTGHRENLLKSGYGRIGIGVVTGNSGVHHYVQEFAD